ncbi:MULTISPECIES: amidase family protein [unclassified Gemella]|uniref:amidase family protein n=1 Tax=unclassified Gemella TaxID=2624949 RepID=UPI001C03CCA8|nr:MULTISPECIES: amidase family protein [unclassified Gemella]MBU0279265.1 amidase [Gemella sp. zg-1178]QWQ38770.1 amidase [Gemella sp. zg-570]
MQKKNKFIAVLLAINIFMSSSMVYAREVPHEANIASSEKDRPAYKLTLEEYKSKSGLELAELVREKKVTSEDLVKLAYEVIDSKNKDLNAVITTQREEALKESKELEDTGQPFLGVPILVKGLGHTTKGGENTNGFVFNKGNISKSDGSMVRELKKMGFIVLGQTNYPEYGLRNITDSKLYGATSNPWNTDYNAGGSSGGSAASISSGMVAIASGSDAGGSIRIPASWTGLVGLKPSRGMIYNANRDSRTPAVHFPLTKNVEDAKVLLEHLRNKKATPLRVSDIKTLPIGYTAISPMGTEVSREAKEALMESVDFFKEQGFSVKEVEWVVNGRDIMRDYTLLSIASAGGFGNLEKKLAEKNYTKKDVDPLVWALYITYRDMDKKELKKQVDEVWKRVATYTNKMEMFHKNFPLLLTPTTATTAPLNTDMYIDKKDLEDMLNIEQLSQEERLKLLNRQWEPMLVKTPFTQIANLTGEPALSIPMYVSSNNLPLGVMLTGSWGMDDILLDIAKIAQDKGRFNLRRVPKSILDNDNYKLKENNLSSIKEYEKEKISNNSLEKTEIKQNSDLEKDTAVRGNSVAISNVSLDIDKNIQDNLIKSEKNILNNNFKLKENNTSNIKDNKKEETRTASLDKKENNSKVDIEKENSKPAIPKNLNPYLLIGSIFILLLLITVFYKIRKK